MGFFSLPFFISFKKKNWGSFRVVLTNQAKPHFAIQTFVILGGVIAMRNKGGVSHYGLAIYIKKKKHLKEKEEL